MLRELLAIKIIELLPSASFEEGGEWLNIQVEPGEFKNLALRLRNEESLKFDFLFCVTGIDWKTHLVMVYHLRSTRYQHNLVVKVKISREDPQIDTVSDIWQTANFHEREVYEMFGVKFINHPDLRLLILPDGWEGKKPMLKDFEDPVNMIRL